MTSGVDATRVVYNTHYTAMIGALCKVSMFEEVEAEVYAEVTPSCPLALFAPRYAEVTPR